MNTVKIDLSMNLQVSDDLLKMLSDPQCLEQFCLKNAFRNNTRVVLGAQLNSKNDDQQSVNAKMLEALNAVRRHGLIEKDGYETVVSMVGLAINDANNVIQDQGKQVIHVITELESGTVQTPHVYLTEQAAGECFEGLVMLEKDKAFRHRKNSESWEEYYEAFQNWYNSDDYPGDTMDWEIHWYEVNIG